MSRARALLAEDSRPRLAERVRLRDDRARGCLVVLGPERVLLPSATAGEVLARCDGQRTVGAIIDELAAQHESDRLAVAADVVSFLQGLVDQGWVRA